MAGLAMVTPGAGYVGPFSAFFMGLAAGGLSYVDHHEERDSSAMTIRWTWSASTGWPGVAAC